MKRLLLLCSVALFLAACTQESEFGNKPIPENLENLDNDSYAVPVEEALKTLSRALDRIDGITRAGRTRSVQSVETVKASRVMNLTRSTPAEGVENLFYVVSFGEGNGSAVLGADKRLAPIYAILDETVLTAEDFQQPETRSEMTEEEGGEISSDEEMKEFVVDMMTAAGTRAIIITPIKPELPDTTYIPKVYEYDTTYEDRLVAPLTRTKWSQGHPFNQSYPMRSDGAGHKWAGCGVIATAQLLTFYQYPSPNTINSTTYDWALINQCYYSSSGTSSFPSTAISTLANYLLALAYELDADWSSDGGTSTNREDVLAYLKAIGYSGARLQNWRTDATSDIARNIIYEQEEPLWVRAETSVGDGHAWVVDGWSECYVTITRRDVTPPFTIKPAETIYQGIWDKMVHCNYGWGGLCDGYYTPTTFDTTTMLDGEFVDTSVGDYRGIGGDLYNKEVYVITLE